MKKTTLFLATMLLGFMAGSQTKTDLSINDWHIWLDVDATWENDELFLPPYDLSRIPSNAPSCGWEELSNQQRTKTQVPATVEEYHWGENGNPFGVSGNYVGVSWFSTSFEVDQDDLDRRMVLHFESVRLRAEVYVNRQLVGYDIINGTPFQVDIGSAAKTGTNQLDVRITDPNGNFAWRDWETYKWGEYDINPSHGFGGITGKVHLEISDKIFIEDLYVKNLPDLKSVAIQTTLAGAEEGLAGELTYIVSDASGTEWYKTTKLSQEAVTSNKITIPEAKAWSPDSPNLYTLQVKWAGKDGSEYTRSKRFGFRWFEVKEISGDKQFHLNGKRIVLRSAISWGHWPVNGIYPTPELARKQIESAKSLGLNMLNFHRGIGQEHVLDLADELGLLYYEEPGGYRPGTSAFALRFKQERLLRMVKRDRSHPSLIIISMINEANRDPFPPEFEDMRLAHELDENRIITFTSTNFGRNTYGGKAPLGAADIKLYMLPADTTQYTYGWWDEHHAGGPGVYLDEFYNGPDNIFRHYDHPNEIIVLGEEGAIGTPPRLELIRSELEKEGKNGWDGDTYRAMYEAFDTYLDKEGFRASFPTVDDLTKSMGEISHYYQGRIIENVRIGNLLDGYIVNGWENTKVENHSGIVDIYRNPKTDPNLLSHYNQPLYIAVKIRNKVLAAGERTLADFFIINETNLKGGYTLEVEVKKEHKTVLSQKQKVRVTGGTQFGELLLEGLEIALDAEGYYEVNARLLKGKETLAIGKDEIYAVDLSVKEISEVVVADTAGVIQQVLGTVPNVRFSTISNPQRIEKGQVLIVGPDMQPNMVRGSFRQTSPVMDWVGRGNKMIVMGGIETWGAYLSDKEILDYRGIREIKRNWFGGCYFVKDHSLFEGLPTSTAFNWEYQFLAAQKRQRIGMRLGNGESIVGVTADHKQEVYDALVVIPHGRGKIIFCALDLLALQTDEAKSSVVAKKLIQNMIKY